MIVLVDAFNLKSGGGTLHLRKILEDPNILSKYAQKIYLLGDSYIGTNLPLPSNVEKILVPCRLGSFSVLLFRLIKYKRLLRNLNIDIVFNPSGVVSNLKCKTVLMSHNMLIHERVERRRYGFSWLFFKFEILDYLQSRAFKQADGIVFLSKYARGIVCDKLGLDEKKYPVINHGVSREFFREIISRNEIESYSKPFKFLYVSNITVYKHQLVLVKVISELIEEGLDISIDLVGGKYEPYYAKVKPYLSDRIRYLGKKDYSEMNKVYALADGIVFASSCENMPNILIEGLLSGKPSLVSCLGPNPEFCASSTLLFDPLSEVDLKCKIVDFINNSKLREISARDNQENAMHYSWENCAVETWTYITEINEGGRKIG